MRIFFILLMAIFIPVRSSLAGLSINSHILDMNNSDFNIAIRKMKDLNIEYVRVDMPWRAVEKEKGVYEIPALWNYRIQELINLKLKPVLIIEYTNPIYKNEKPLNKNEEMAFLKYAKYVAEKYKNKVFYYELWNEWDSTLGGGEPGTVGQYINLLKGFYPTIKSVNDENRVIAGSFTADSFDKIFGLGVKDENREFLQDKNVYKYFDIYSIHTYVTGRKKPYDEYKYFIDEVKYIKDLIDESRFKNKKIFITEMGWSTANNGYSVSEKMQGQLLSQAYCDTKKLGVSAFFIYDLKNDYPSDGKDAHTAAAFGLFNYDWKPKESYSILKGLNCDEIK